MAHIQRSCTCVSALNDYFNPASIILLLDGPGLVNLGTANFMISVFCREVVEQFLIV